MLEQETAGIIKFVLEAAGDPTPYYGNVPEGFAVPSAFFPSPDISYQPDSLSSYEADCCLYIKFFHSSNEDAYSMASEVFDCINKVHGMIPLADLSGSPTGKYIRIKNTAVSKADECAYQLQVDWSSSRPYSLEEAERIQNFYINKEVHGV